MRTSIRAAFVVVLTLSFAATVRASVARAVSFQEKVERADGIILGRCVRQHSEFDPSGRWIVTYSTFQVERSYKGEAAAEVTVVTPGGQVGSLHQETIGVPRFGEGESHVLFIRRTQAGPTVLFLDQGAYTVTTTQGREAVVAPVQSDLVLVDSTGRPAAGAAEAPRRLSDFERAIGAALRERRIQR